MRRLGGCIGAGLRVVVAAPPGSGVVLGAVDAVGVGGQRRHARRAVQLQRERQQELTAAAAATLRPGRQRDRALAAADEGHWRREGRAGRTMLAHLSHQRRIDLGDLARLAGHGIAQHHRAHAGRLEHGGCRLQTSLGGGDDDVAHAAQARIAGLGRLLGCAGSAARQVLCHRRRHGTAMARQDRLRVGVGGRIGGAGTRSDVGWVIAGHVGHHQREHRGAAGRRLQRQPPALDTRQVLAHHVDLLDRRAAAQQLARHRFQLRHADTVSGQRQQA